MSLTASIERVRRDVQALGALLRVGHDLSRREFPVNGDATQAEDQLAAVFAGAEALFGAVDDQFDSLLATAAEVRHGD